MALVTRTIATAYGGAASFTFQYNDGTPNLWMTAVIVTVDQASRQWSATVTDTANGHTFSAIRGAGTYPVPANQISLAKRAGAIFPQNSGFDGIGSRLTYSVRYPA